MKITIFTDGSSKGNPGKGGYGIILSSGKHYKELSQGFRYTTNNRMELLAVIIGLESLKKSHSEVLIVSDSKYVVDAVVKGWVFDWHKKNFKGKKNADLWKRFLKTYNMHKVDFKWIKGHAGHHQNEKCDFLAVCATENQNLLIDKGYEDLNSFSI